MLMVTQAGETNPMTGGFPLGAVLQSYEAEGVEADSGAEADFDGKIYNRSHLGKGP